MSVDNKSDRIYFSSRGVVNLPLGGQDRQLRFRTHEINLLEAKRKMGILSMLDDKQLGLSFLTDAIAVGVAHEYIGKKGNRLTERVVTKWIDNCEDVDNIPFEDLLQTIVKAVVGGLPNGAAMVKAMDDGLAGDDDGQGGSKGPQAVASAPAKSA